MLELLSFIIPNQFIILAPVVMLQLLWTVRKYPQRKPIISST